MNYKSGVLKICIYILNNTLKEGKEIDLSCYCNKSTNLSKRCRRRGGGGAMGKGLTSNWKRVRIVHESSKKIS